MTDTRTALVTTARETVRRVMRRAGYTVFATPAGHDLREALPVEQVAQGLVLQGVLERLDVSCVLDVGAHVGEFGTSLRAGGYAGAIVSFEPVAESFAALRDRAAGSPPWHVHHTALGARDGTASLGVARESNFSSFLAPSALAASRFAGSAVARREDVPVRRLDAVFDDVTAHLDDPRVLLKTDTQGWDLEVLEGAAGCLDRVAAVQMELSVRPVYEGGPAWTASLAVLAELGFRPAHLTTVSRDDALGIIELDALLIR